MAVQARLSEVEREGLLDNPYVGPRPFSEAEKHLFFGREREAESLLSLVISEPLVLFFAQSGAGKTSLINAGLIPKLRERGFQVLPVGRVGGVLPPKIEADNIFIFNLILSLNQDRSDPAGLAGVRLAEFLAGLPSQVGSDANAQQTKSSAIMEPAPRILIIDQFEEMMTTYPERASDREDFFRQLGQALQNEPQLHVIFSLREDYVGSLDPFAQLLPGAMRGRYYMPRLEAEAALEAIRRPAELAGRPFAPGVAESLAENLRQIRVQDQAQISFALGQFIEPVQLQVVCYQLWEAIRQRSGSEITVEDVAALGDVDAALTNFYETILRQTVSETGISEAALRDWVDRQLIAEAGTRGMIYRGETSTAGIPNQVVDRLADQFLLRAEVRAGATWYELAHDRLVEPILRANQQWQEAQAHRPSEPGAQDEAEQKIEAESPVESELIEPYGQADGPRQRYEEVLAGISYSGNDLSPHTITALVIDRVSHKSRLLLAGSTFPAETEVFQPNPAHDRNNQNKIGLVERAIANNRCFGAIARLEGERPFVSTLPNGKCLNSIASPRQGLQVHKFGGETGYAQGVIDQTNIDFLVNDHRQRRVQLDNCFVIKGPFSSPGDIGAPVVTTDTNELVGVVVGSTPAETLCQPIQSVLDQLGVTLITQPVRYTRTQQVTEHIVAANDRAEGQDRLGFEEYAKAFVRLIQDTTPPLTIGIYGAWGTGKSFLMNLIKTRLGDLPLPSRPVIVEFEAWDYNASEKLWAGLVKQIFQTVEQRLGWYGQLRLSLEPTLERKWRELKPKLLPYTLILIVLCGLIVAFALNNQPAIAQILTRLSAAGLLIEVARQIIGILLTPASQRIVDLFSIPDYRKKIDFLEQVRDDLQNLARKLPDQMKIVVFIDDLDRCDPKKAVEVIEAVKLLLDFERFIVFLAIDARIITQAVEEFYGKILVEAEITGYEYLDKIVQIPFSIPEPPLQELRRYLGSLVDLEEVPPLEAVAKVVEKEQPPTFIPEPVTVQAVSTPVSPSTPASPSTDGPAEGPAMAVTQAVASEEQGVAQHEPPPNVVPTPAEQAKPRREIEERYDTTRVTFTQEEQLAFLTFYEFLDSNPRRLKRLVNIYRLVRTLIAGRRQAATESPTPDIAPRIVPENPHYILGWLILCEQWPYAAHVMLEVLDQNLKRTALEPNVQQELLAYPVIQLYEVAQIRIGQSEDKALQKLDLKYDRLEGFIKTHLPDLTLADIERLRPFTVNFNPALSAEVRLTLAKRGG